MRSGVSRGAIIGTLRAREAELRAHGVTHAAVFGSVGRDAQRPDSGIDILVDLDPAVVATMVDDAGLKADVTSLFPRSLDGIDREALKPRLSTPRGRRRDHGVLTPNATRWRPPAAPSPARGREQAPAGLRSIAEGRRRPSVPIFGKML